MPLNRRQNPRQSVDAIRNGLFVRVPPRRSEPTVGTATHYTCFALDADQTVRVGHVSLAELAQAQQPVTLLLAAEDVSLTTAIVPALSGRHLRTALPNLVEDRSLSEVTTLHVAQLEVGTDGSTGLALVDRAWLASVLTRFKAAGLRVHYVWPESLCLPWSADQWSLAAVADADHRIISLWLRTGHGSAIALPHDGRDADLSSAQLLLQALIEQAGTASGPLHLYAEAALLPRLQALAAASSSMPVSTHAGDPARLWLEAGRSTVPRSLLQHELAPVNGAGQWPVWRRVAFLLLALAAVQLAGQQWQWAQLRADRSHLREQAATLLRTAFPETTTILDAPLQMERGLASLRARANQSSPGDFSALIAAAGGIFSDEPVNAFQGLAFGDETNETTQRNALRIQLAPGIATNPQEQEQLRQRATAAGYALRFDASPLSTSKTAAGMLALLSAKGVN